MGSKTSKSSPLILYTLPKSDDKYAHIQIKYMSTTSNSELAIGDREMISIYGNTLQGSKTKEMGALSVSNYFKFDSVEDFSNFLKNTFLDKKYYDLKNQAKSKMNTSGSNAGSSIIYLDEGAQYRHQVQSTERFVLNGNNKVQYDTIVNELKQKSDELLNNGNVKIGLTIDSSILKLYGLLKDEDIQEVPLNVKVLFENNEATGLSIVKVTSSLDQDCKNLKEYNDEKNSNEKWYRIEIDSLYVPSKTPVKFEICKYSVLDEEEEDEPSEKDTKVKEEDNQDNQSEMKFVTSKPISFDSSDKNYELKLVDKKLCIEEMELG